MLNVAKAGQQVPQVFPFERDHTVSYVSHFKIEFAQPTARSVEVAGYIGTAGENTATSYRKRAQNLGQRMSAQPTSSSERFLR